MDIYANFVQIIIEKSISIYNSTSLKKNFYDDK